MSSLRLDRVKVKKDRVEYINKKTNFEVIYWKASRFFTIKNVGLLYHFIPLTVAGSLYEDLLYSREPIEIRIVLLDKKIVRNNQFLFILTDLYPPTSVRGLTSLTMIKKETVVVNELTNELVIYVKKVSPVSNIDDAIEKILLEGPAIITSLNTGSVSEEYLPWIECFGKNITT